jgi:2,3,4,5-tetrahydropyridine-2,6-dicarboxylate N-succinyltransferase
MTSHSTAASSVFAFGIGIARTSGAGAIIDCWFPDPWLAPGAAAAQVIAAHFPSGASTAAPEAVAAFAAAVESSVGGETAARADRLARALAASDQPLHVVRLDRDAEIESTEEAYLKLHLLSFRRTLPNTLDLASLFSHLPNVAWTSAGAIAIAELEAAQIDARLRGEHLEVFSVDKFPRMANYVVPTGVRIADASRIRLGAYLGEGTTVMHEGFVNFNAGALGPNMIEGRISQGVVVGAHSDLGGSSSTMGTLSGGGSITITIGEHCLIGANAGTGIPLGDRCTIEAGLYITAGTRVAVIDEHGATVKSVRARDLAGGSDMLFIRNSATGRVECRTNRKAIELNEQLHAHN